MGRVKLGRGWTLGVTALAAMLMLGVFLAQGRLPRALETLPAPTVVTGQGHPAAQGQLNINTATVQQLMELPGIGAVRAQAIVDDRAANGPYRYPEQLMRVKGIGQGVLVGLLDKITVGGN